MTDATVEVTHDEAGRRYRGVVAGECVATLAYVSRSGVLHLVHTEVEPEARGRGIGEELVRKVLDELRATRTRIVVTCPFVTAFIDRNPEYRELAH